MSDTPKPFDKNKYGWPEKQERDLSSRDGIGVAPIMRDSDGTGLVSKETVQKRIKRREAAKDKVKNSSPSEAGEAANKYKGIIQLAVVAVVIAGTVEAFVWGKN